MAKTTNTAMDLKEPTTRGLKRQLLLQRTTKD